MNIELDKYMEKTAFEIGIPELEVYMPDSIKLIKWVRTAIPKNNYHPELKGVQIENIIKQSDNVYSAEFIATNGISLHHALVYLPERIESEGMHTISLHNNILALEPIDYKFPDWKRIVDYDLFTLTETSSKFPHIDGKYLQQAIPPMIIDDSLDVMIKYKDNTHPLLIHRSRNNNNYAVIMPRI